MDVDTDEDVTTKQIRPPKKARKLSPKRKDRPGVKALELRRPVRPVDREKMGPWLRNHLDSNSVFGLFWDNKQEGVFQVSWRHASRLGWKLETDGDVFEKWARHTGIFKDGDEPEPKRWKANFRCAIHSLPDVKELTDPGQRRGHNAFRKYRFLDPEEVGPQVKQRKTTPAQPVAAPEPVQYEEYEAGPQANEDSEDSASEHADSEDRTTDSDTQYREIHVIPDGSDHEYAAKMGRLEGGESVTKVGSGYVVIKTKKSSKLPSKLPSSLPTVLAEALERQQTPEHPRTSHRPDSPSSMQVIKVAKRPSALNKGKGQLKINTKTLLSGNKKPRVFRTSQHTSQAQKKSGFLASLGSREKQAESGTASSGGFDFEDLLKAANMARMSTLTSTTAGTCAPAPTAVRAFSGFPASSLRASTPVPDSHAPAVYTVFKELPNPVPSLSPDNAVSVKTEGESSVSRVQPEATGSSHMPLESLPHALFEAVLQNLMSGSSVSSVLPKSLPKCSQSGPVVVKLESSSSTPSSPVAQLNSLSTSEVLRQPGDEAAMASTSDSLPVIISSNDGGGLTGLSYMFGNQTVSHAACGVYTTTSSHPSNTSVTLNNPLNNASVSEADIKKTMFFGSSIKTDPSDSDMKAEGDTIKPEPLVGSSEQVDLAPSLEVDRSSLPQENLSRYNIGASLPGTSVLHVQSSSPTEQSNDAPQCKQSSVQNEVPVLKDISTSSSGYSNLNCSQTGASHTEGPPAAQSSGGQPLIGQPLVAQPQTVNMGPVFVMNPSIVLTLPVQTTSTSQQQDPGSVLNMHVTDLQQLFNLFINSGALQVVQNADGASTSQEPAPSDAGDVAHQSDSVVSPAGESGAEAVSCGGVDLQSHVVASESQEESSAVQATQDS